MLNAIDGVIANMDSFNRLGKLLVIGPFLAPIWAAAHRRPGILIDFSEQQSAIN